jgi:DNA-binding GntR family transcriptional regulator
MRRPASAVRRRSNDRSQMMSAPSEAAAEALPLYEVIYRVLRRHIADESFPNGLVIGEAAVARAFQSSRIPAGAALRRLKDEGLLRSFDGRGLMVGAVAGTAPLRLDLIEAGLTLPETASLHPTARNHRVRLYPEVEHIVASCQFYGRFQLNESLLADHYRVSRTVAHEIITQLDRAGLIEQDRNRRWYAGPLTVERMREHFELRWLLEPVALDQAFLHLNQADLAAKTERVRSVLAGRRTPAKLERLERDLHIDTVLRCSNSRLGEAIMRNQLPLFATHDTFQRHLDSEEVDLMLAEHLAIFQHLAAGERGKARRSLERHLKRSVESNVRRLGTLGPLPESRRVPFLTAAD